MTTTPGPWESTHAQPLGGDAWHWIAGSRGTPAIAKVFGCGSARGEADAALIAAAPVLLEAAKRVEAWLTSGIKFVGQQGEETADLPIQWLRSAIAAAEKTE